MPRLDVRAPHRERSLSFERNAVLGRSKDADLALTDRGVSARHAMVRRGEGGCFVVDLGSHNGTYVNQRRVEQPVRLRDGDVLRVGDTLVEFHADDAPAAAPGTGIQLTDTDHAESFVHASMPAEQTIIGSLTDLEHGGVHGALARQARLLEKLGRSLTRSLNPDDMLAQVADGLLACLPRAERVIIALGTSVDDMRLSIARTRDATTSSVTISRTLLRRALEQHEGLLFTDLKLDRKYADAESIRSTGLRSALCVPMVFDNEIHGLIQVDNSRNVAAFSQTDLRAVVGVASHAATSLGYARLHAAQLEQRLLAHDLSLAHRVQRQFLPERPPDVPGCTFAAHYEAALAIGGDLYDFVPLGRHRIGLVVGDVSGKGVSAALYAAKVASDLRWLASLRPEPSKILEELNRGLANIDREGMFVTVAFVLLDAASWELTVVTAGHPLPLVRSREGEVQALGHTGAPPLGIVPDAVFPAHRYGLDPGDTVVLFSDGVTEATASDGTIFGVDALSTAMARARGGAATVQAAILDALGRFTQDAKQSDDITLLSLSRG